MDQTNQTKPKITLSDRARVLFKGILDPIGAFLNRLGIYPNTITILGLVGNVIAAALIATGHLTVGGIVALAMGLFDTLDGTMARLRGMPSDFGAFVDSVSDRYSELLIFGGLGYYYGQKEDWLSVLAIYLAASGAVMVSYTRARAASLGMDTKIGIMGRFERYLVLAPTLIFAIPMVGVWIIAILAHFTALQRILDVRRQAFEQNKILIKNKK